MAVRYLKLSKRTRTVERPTALLMPDFTMAVRILKGARSAGTKRNLIMPRQDGILRPKMTAEGIFFIAQRLNVEIDFQRRRVRSPASGSGEREREGSITLRR